MVFPRQLGLNVNLSAQAANHGCLLDLDSRVSNV